MYPVQLVAVSVDAKKRRAYVLKTPASGRE